VSRFYFDVRDDGTIIPDDEGSEFESLEAAVHAAACATAEIGTDRLAKGDTRDVVIEVRDDQGQRVCTVTASMTIDWHNLSSQPSDLGQAWFA
jgi:predicted regulator of Ras-like GTPase activity (Roadblock/LC7/MglB family)